MAPAPVNLRPGGEGGDTVVTMLVSVLQGIAWLLAALAGALLVLALLGPWHLRATGRVRASFQGSLVASWCWGLMWFRLTTGAPGQEDSPGPSRDLEVRIAGIPVIRRLDPGPGDRPGPKRPRHSRRRARREARRKPAGGNRGFDARALPRLVRQMRDEGWLGTALGTVRRLTRTFHLQFGADGTYATPDPAWTGWIAALQGALGPLLDTATKGRIALKARPDFTDTLSDLTLAGQTRFTPIAVLATVLSLMAKKDVRRLIRALRDLRKAPGGRKPKVHKEAVSRG